MNFEIKRQIANTPVTDFKPIIFNDPTVSGFDASNIEKVRIENIEFNEPIPEWNTLPKKLLTYEDKSMNVTELDCSFTNADVVCYVDDTLIGNNGVHGKKVRILPRAPFNSLKGQLEEVGEIKRS